MDMSANWGLLEPLRLETDPKSPGAWDKVYARGLYLKPASCGGQSKVPQPDHDMQAALATYHKVAPAQARNGRISDMTWRAKMTPRSATGSPAVCNAVAVQVLQV